MKTEPGRRSVRAAILAVSLALLSVSSLGLSAQAPTAATGVKFARISPGEMKEWLTYLSSDQLQGRQIFTEGYALAAAYVADHLRQWGVKPLGEDGTYFQTVKLKGYHTTRRSSVTVDVNGQTRTFKDGEHVTFPANAGGPQMQSFNGVEFVGSGLVVPDIKHDDYSGRDVKAKLVVWMGNGPRTLPQGAGRLLNARGQYAIETRGANASIGYASPPTAAEQALAQAQAALAQANQAVAQAQQGLLQARRGGGGRGVGGGGPDGGGAGRGNQPPSTDFTAVERVDHLLPPQFTADDDFFTFLLSAAPTKFPELKAAADRGDGLPALSLSNVKVILTIDNSYDLVSTRFSKNVVGLIEGTDARLRGTYVLFGAHLDHLGYLTAPRDGNPDLIFNGADDDGSGTTAELAIAKAFATGPKPKRSLVFTWHTGEEGGLSGSRYNADFPVIDLDKVQCQLNMDMIGRNADNDPRNANQVYIVGDDRISTDLHNLVGDVNNAQSKPLALDYAWNDPTDLQRIYFRSDHYSYAAKGIPIAFFTTGLHPDYHQVSDTVDKIQFDKMARIAQLIYETGFSVANTDKVLERDNKGPRAGKGSVGKITR